MWASPYSLRIAEHLLMTSCVLCHCCSLSFHSLVTSSEFPHHLGSSSSCDKMFLKIIWRVSEWGIRLPVLVNPLHYFWELCQSPLWDFFADKQNAERLIQRRLHAFLKRRLSSFLASYILFINLLCSLIILAVNSLDQTVSFQKCLYRAWHNGEHQSWLEALKYY